MTNHATERGAVSQNPQHLFDCWSQVAERVRTAGRLALFLDFDGTLVNYQAHREGVKLSGGAKQALRRLAKRGGGLAALHWAMGTREAGPIKDFVDLFGGCHGGPDRKYKVSSSARRC